MWNEICSEIFFQFVEELNKNNIRYFVLRNYEDLPKKNPGKDIDIVVEPAKLSAAKALVKEAYKKNGITHYDESVFDTLHCAHGIGMEIHTGIHIDLLEGYKAKGYEIYTFSELYQHVEKYKNFYVLSELWDGIMLLVSKLFGYRKPVLKEKYMTKILEAYEKYPSQFERELSKITSVKFARQWIFYLKNKSIDKIIQESGKFSKELKRYCFRKHPMRTVWGKVRYIYGKAERIVFRYKKCMRSFTVLAPDGAGKTTFLEHLTEQLNYYYVSDKNDNKFHIYHFRPGIFPNLGEIGERTGIMEQDTNWSNPHRSKPANPLSSLLRMTYYILDYIIGWQRRVRNDVRFDRYSIFDRYSYDLIVDPKRTKIGLPIWVIKGFVALTPKPPIVFFLKAAPETVYARKQELPLEEIRRQTSAYEKLAKQYKNFYVLDAEQSVEEITENALKVIMNKYLEKIG